MTGSAHWRAGGPAGPLQRAGDAPDIHLEGDPGIAVPGQPGHVADVQLPAAQRSRAEHVPQAVPGPPRRPVPPPGRKERGLEDTAVEVTRPPVLARRRGKHDALRIAPGGLLLPDPGDPDGDHLRQRVARWRFARVDSAAPLAALRRLYVHVAADLDDFPVHGHLPQFLVNAVSG